LGSMLR
jgi:ABC-type multidrug transport system fused ATPase/permease subunit